MFKIIWNLLSLIFTGHIHQWGKWENWGVVYQEKRCLVCGKRKIIGKK